MTQTESALQRIRHRNVIEAFQAVISSLAADVVNSTVAKKAGQPSGREGLEWIHQLGALRS
jgi:hypothetical protein